VIKFIVSMVSIIDMKSTQESYMKMNLSDIVVRYIVFFLIDKNYAMKEVRRLRAKR